MNAAPAREQPKVPAMRLCGPWEIAMSPDSAAVARWLLSVIPPEEHGTLCDVFPSARIVAWADTRPVLRVEDIRNRFDVSRATAYRWMAALRAGDSIEDDR